MHGPRLATTNATVLSLCRGSDYSRCMLGELARRTKRPSRAICGSWLKSLVAVVCISLVMLGGMLSVTHSHKAMGPSHPDCGLCLVAHTAIHTGTPAPEIVVVKVFTRVEVAPEIPDLPSISLEPLFSRPPPADLNRA